MDLLARMGLRKKKTRREKIQDVTSEAVHSIADAFDELLHSMRKGSPSVVQKAQERAQAAKEEAPRIAKKVQESLKDVSDQVATIAEQSTERVAETTEEIAESALEAKNEARAKMGVLLTTLGALTANWDEITEALTKELDQREKARATKKKRRRFPGFWLWLLRLGVGLNAVEWLRSTDLPAYIDHGAGDRLRQQAKAHPVASYKQWLDDVLIPNASLVAIAEIAATAWVALGSLFGWKRRFTALLGAVLSGYNLVSDLQNNAKRGQHLLVLVSELLLLRTGA